MWIKFFKKKVKWQHALLEEIILSVTLEQNVYYHLWGWNPEAARAAECGKKSAESKNDPETRDSEALIKRGDGLCSAPGDNIMRHASCPARVSLSLLSRSTRARLQHFFFPFDTHTSTFPFFCFFPDPISPMIELIRWALFLNSLLTSPVP